VKSADLDASDTNVMTVHEAARYRIEQHEDGTVSLYVDGIEQWIQQLSTIGTEPDGARRMRDPKTGAEFYVRRRL
jgi:hypothetical protein